MRLIHRFENSVEDILNLQKISAGELLPWRNPKSVGWLRLGNRLFGDAVLIRRRRALFPIVVILPQKPDEFVESLKVRLSADIRMRRG